ncbi:MaoC family dehydratase [Saccharothrix obliqua]|uniref:MaoC family dehydratase n=1 Tax=Saccharothrix obliqua TaxID=2861747 RepID=UPI001C5F6607|nr:MaoC family dehydratase [Saccharothrix obliqua]MBW4715926.1 MaoC family dehydratase [Saccharothrix obliqua]
MIRAAEVSVGDVLPPLALRITRADLVRYAGASGDFNPIHWNQRFAEQVGLPGVIAHGMLTMGMAVRVVTEWAGDPGAVVEYGVRFGRPVPVPDDDEGALVEATGKVTKVLDDGTFKVNVTASFEGRSVLGGAFARVRLP